MLSKQLPWACRLILGGLSNQPTTTKLVLVAIQDPYRIQSMLQRKFFFVSSKVCRGCLFLSTFSITVNGIQTLYQTITVDSPQPPPHTTLIIITSDLFKYN